MPGIVDIAGQRFGRLIAIQPIGSDTKGYKRWLCRQYRYSCNRIAAAQESPLVGKDST